MTNSYIQGYMASEQDRLRKQSKFWKEKLILRDLGIKTNTKKTLLEIGCGIGSVLEIFAETFPNIELSGIDIEEKQINLACSSLKNRYSHKIDLRVGNANNLPWKNNSFDYIFGIWFLEHIKEPTPILKECYRVLKPGGKIILIESDLMSLFTYPESSEYLYLKQSMWELLDKNGNAYIGRTFGFLLDNIGFINISNNLCGYNYWGAELAEYVDYICDWLKPHITKMVEQLNKNELKLWSGLSFFQSLKHNSSASASVSIYKAYGFKPL